MTEKRGKNSKHCCEGVSKGDCKFDSIVSLFSFVILYPQEHNWSMTKIKGLKWLSHPKNGDRSSITPKCFIVWKLLADCALPPYYPATYQIIHTEIWNIDLSEIISLCGKKATTE